MAETDSEATTSRGKGPAPRKGRVRRGAGKALSWAVALLISLAACVAAAEVYLRLTLPYKPNLSLYEPDLDLGYRLKPCRGAQDYGAKLDVSSQGLRDREFPLKRSPGTLRILALGDSWTFGAGVETHQAWPKLLEERLRGGPVPVEVVNAGVAGYETWNEAAFYERDLKKFQHDLVLVAVYPVNDVHSSGSKIERNRRMHAIHPWLYRFYEYQKRCLYLQHVYETWRQGRREKRLAAHYGKPSEGQTGHALGPGQQDWTRFYCEGYDGWQGMKRSFRSIGRTARESGARGVVILLPDNQDLGRYVNVAHPLVAPRIRQAAEEAGLEFVDLSDAFAPYAGREASIALGDTPGATHLNAAGYAVVADEVARQLKEKGLLETRDAGPQPPPPRESRDAGEAGRG